MIKNIIDPKNAYMFQDIPVKATDTVTGELIGTFPSMKKASNTLLIPLSLISKRLKAQKTSQELQPVFSRRLNKKIYIERLKPEP